MKEVAVRQPLSLGRNIRKMRFEELGHPPGIEPNIYVYHMYIYYEGDEV